MFLGSKHTKNPFGIGNKMSKNLQSLGFKHMGNKNDSQKITSQQTNIRDNSSNVDNNASVPMGISQNQNKMYKKSSLEKSI
jgi:hypothetical protein